MTKSSDNTYDIYIPEDTESWSINIAKDNITLNEKATYEDDYLRHISFSISSSIDSFELSLSNSKILIKLND